MVIRQGRMLKMTAVGDKFVGRIIAYSVRFTGSGLTPGQFAQLTDINGTLVTEHYVKDQNESLALLESGLKIFMNGAIVTQLPAGAEFLIPLI